MCCVSDPCGIVAHTARRAGVATHTTLQCALALSKAPSPELPRAMQIGPSHADVKGVRHWRAPVSVLVTTTLYIYTYTYLWLVYVYVYMYSGVSPRLITACPVQPKTADRRMCIQIYLCILNYTYLRHTCPVHIYKRLSKRLTVERPVQNKTRIIYNSRYSTVHNLE